jgi:hypothetical protein
MCWWQLLCNEEREGGRRRTCLRPDASLSFGHACMAYMHYKSCLTLYTSQV